MVNKKTLTTFVLIIFLSGCASNNKEIKTNSDYLVDKHILESSALISKVQFELHQTGKYAILPISPLSKKQ